MNREAEMERSGSPWLVIESYRAARMAEAMAQGDAMTAMKAMSQLPRVVVHQNARKVRVSLKDDGTAGMQARWRVARGIGKRGECKGFSDASRRNLMDKMNQVRRDAEKPVFITMTLARELGFTAADAKGALRAFSKRLARAFGDVCVLWRLEPQEDGTAHFHLLVWGAGGYIPWQWVAVKWAEVCTGEKMGDPPTLPGKHGAWVFREWVKKSGASEVGKKMCNAGTKVEAIRSFNGVLFYVAKYMAKEWELEHPEKWGRVWGIMGERDGVFDTAEIVIVSPETAYKVVTAIRRSIRAKVGWRAFVEKTMKVYTDTPGAVWKIIGGCQ